MEKIETDAPFQQLMETFPPTVHESLQTIPQAGGVLIAEHCRLVMDVLNISIETLMAHLLPISKLYCRTAISAFQVGAAAKARMSDNAGDMAIFLGANIEFPGQALIQTIHAEQSAVINAWLQGARQIESIAVTAPPCGYCRQFLYELVGRQHLNIILPDQIGGKMIQHSLLDLLPMAFGPHELGSATGLMASSTYRPDLNLRSSSDDSLVLEAKAAAEKSYAPYSQNIAGCAIKTIEGKVYAGRFAENAAFNPSLTTLQTAFIRMTMDQPGSTNRIVRAVLVERPTSISQRAISELLLQTIAPNVRLEYFEAE